MLTLDEELEISKKLSSRYQIREKYANKLGVNKSRITRDDLELDREKRSWDAGNEAAHELVMAYIPFIRSTAQEVTKQYNIDECSSPNWHDLVGEGILAAYTCTWAFNLNGRESGRLGKRFNSYAKPHVKKNMKRLVMKGKTTLKVDVDTIQTSWAWRNTEDTLREQLDRKPTDEEVRSSLYFKAGKNEPNLPMRNSFIDIDDHNSGGGNMIPDKVTEFTSEKDAQDAARRLHSAFSMVVGEDIANDAVDYLGLDRGWFRDDKECAELWGVSTFFSRKRIALVSTVMIHPATRVKMAELLEDEIWGISD